MKILQNKTILITGGTGLVGKAFVSMTLKKLKPKKIIMGPENPAWLKMYVEEMAKRKTALSANVLKKWIAEDTRIELRPDISR